jgi:hypothetical protein
MILEVLMCIQQFHARSIAKGTENLKFQKAPVRHNRREISF